MARTAAANTPGSMPSHQDQCEPATRTIWRRLRSGITLPHRRHFNTNCPPLPHAGWLSTKTGSQVHRHPGALGQDVIQVRACAMLSLASSLNSTLATQYVYTVGYPLMNQPNTGKFKYTVTHLTTSQPQFIFPATSTGFNRASTNIFSSSILPSQNVIRSQAKV